MNENTTAAALFFALVSIGAMIKGDDVVGIGVGAIAAIVSAFFLKRSIMQAAIAEEDNQQRLEIQFQQLRHKLNGTGDVTGEEMVHAIDKGTDRLEEELQVIRDRLSGLENLEQLAQIVETNEEIKSTINSFVESSKERQAILKKLSDNTEASAKLSKVNVEKMSEVSEKLSSIDENSQKLNEVSETNKTTLQTSVKLLTAVGQMLKVPAFAKDLTQLNKSMETLLEKIDRLEKLDELDKLSTLEKLETLDKLESLEEIKATMNEVVNNISELTKVTEIISTQGQTTVDGLERVTESNHVVAENINQTTENISTLNISVEKATLELTAAIKIMQDDITKLTTKIDAFNGMMKAAIEQYSTLSEQDVKVLEKIAEKVQ